jgi:hypothetical protein
MFPTPTTELPEVEVPTSLLGYTTVYRGLSVTADSMICTTERELQLV